MSDPKFSDVRDCCLNFLVVKEEWRFTERARTDGYRLGLTELRMIDLIVGLLGDGHSLHEIHLGDPPGSGGLGYEMRTTGEQGLYIKLKVEWNFVLILSFKKNRER